MPGRRQVNATGRTRRGVGCALTVLLVLIVAGSAQANLQQWSSGGPPSTGAVPGPSRVMAVDRQRSATIYVAGFGLGVFKSVDGGATWSGTGPPSEFLLSLAVASAAGVRVWGGYVTTRASTDGRAGAR